MRLAPLAVLLVLAAVTAAATAAAAAPSVVDPRFALVRAAAPAKLATAMPATIRFAFPPDEATLAKLEAIGVTFERLEGRRLGGANVYPVTLGDAALGAIDGVPGIASVQPSWRPFHVPPLDVSRPAIEADSAWKRTGADGRALTGHGVLIADFDTGVDFFDPMFWFADGDTLAWIDADASGTFASGADAVDLNHDGIAQADETLRVREMGYSTNTAGTFDTDLDFLWNDANGNGARDQGTGAGFTEASPTYGERWFVALDANGNRRLDPGEKLVALKTCKIRAIRETDGTIRRRGVDLIEASPDGGPYGGHGTSVCGIAIGGVPGVHRLCGVAPGAEMIIGSIAYETTPRFFTGLATLMAWGEAEGANVMLVEDGEWAWEYLDGSSNEEQMINALAASGIVQVMPTGNLTGGGMQATWNVPAHDSLTVTFTGGASSHVWPSIRWRTDPSACAVRMQVGASGYVTLPGDGTTRAIGAKTVGSLRTVSSRGTVMMAIDIPASGSATYSVRLVNAGASALRVDGILADDGFGWSGLARWSAPTENNTATWPSTADSAIGVGAYRNKSATTDINTFSGRGTRIDGARIVDVCAPGSTVYTVGLSTTNYAAFGGTSSAGPHAAGAAALLLQADPNLRHRGVAARFAAGAATDTYTGAVPNTTWGFGKLRIVRALDAIVAGVEPTPPAREALAFAPASPNPFAGAVALRWRLPRRERVTLGVFDVQGRRVAALLDATQDAGEHALEWRPGALANGVYFARLAAGDRTLVRRLVRMR